MKVRMSKKKLAVPANVFEDYEATVEEMRTMERDYPQIRQYQRLVDRLEELAARVKDESRARVADITSGERTVFTGRFVKVVVQAKQERDRWDAERIWKALGEERATKAGLVVVRREAVAERCEAIIHGSEAVEDLRLLVADARIAGKRLTPAVSIKPVDNDPA